MTITHRLVYIQYISIMTHKLDISDAEQYLLLGQYSNLVVEVYKNPNL